MPNVSARLANKLVNAESAQAFFRLRGGRIGWQGFAALKGEVDRLVHSDLNAALLLVVRVEQLAALTDDTISKAFAAAGRARVLHLLGRHADANVFYERAVKALRKSRLGIEAAIVRKQQVDALTHMGRYRDALRAAQESRRVLAPRDRVQLAQLEANVGNIYYLMGGYKKALEHYDLAREILAARGDRKMLALVDMSRANVLTELDQPGEALVLLQAAAKTLDRAGQFVVAAQARFHIAYLQLLRGNYNAALSGYGEAREQLAALGSVHLVAWCDLETAEILLALNAFDEASESAQQATSTFVDLAMTYDAAKGRMITALALMGLRQFERAQSELGEARAVFAANRNTTFAALCDSYLAELALKRGQPAEALIRAELAYRVFARQKLAIKAAHSRLLAARAVYQAGDRRRAARWTKAALRLVGDRFAPAVVYMCHHLHGKLDRDSGRTVAALSSFRHAVETVERMRGGIAADQFKATFLSDKVEVYEDTIAACLDVGGGELIEEAFALVESSKSRALADMVARYLRKPAQPMRSDANEAVRARLLKLIEDLNWYSSHANLEDERGGQRRARSADRYSREVLRCERQISELFRSVEASDSGLDDLQRAAAITASELRAALEPGEIVIEYFIVSDRLSAFVVTPDRIEVVRAIAPVTEVETELAGLRFQMEKFNFGREYADQHFEQLNSGTTQYLARLYQKLISPIEPLLTGKRLIVIPHGLVHYVPFHALLNRRGYLVDQFEISYAPSATVLNLCRRESQRTRSGFKSGFGRGKEMVALGLAGADTPSIVEEIDTLEALFPNAVTLVGSRATRSNLLKAAPGARFIHLASHGYFRRDNPMFSFLKLADSHLNFYSLLDLKLNAELVTLSACHTGVNKVFPGDELHGLMRGFLHAGAPSLVASLWATSDASTARLMKEMYGQIRAGASKRAALRAAQIAVKNEYGHPYYWAPFILMGNPN